MLVEAENRFDALVVAGELAGSLDPSVAHAAFLALCQLRERKGWSQATFEVALAGASENEEQNAAVLTWDRTLLRARWVLPTRSGPELPVPRDLFAPLRVPPTPEASTLLRQALEHVAHRSAPAGAAERKRAITPSWGADRPGFLEVGSVQQLEHLMEQATAWPLDLPEHYLQVHWCCYGEYGEAGARETREAESAGRPRRHRSGRAVLYHGSYRWEAGQEPESAVMGSASLHRELWVLFAACPHRARLEAAWQMWLGSWSAKQEIGLAPLAQGLQELWSVLAAATL
ncbi:MAG: hypothetical protein IRZ31_20605 [Thermogemmatispora sp.]|uniref:hypothetical protein n=1 Tax=Thermogemmatispora sp. TaxID=1968838 RepID=UPI0026305CB7|nr:hypothetical protein [Thermogemmatispora sp.]MBX5459302.1 hypothetical protein [Thermogemmatispora sp.]